MTDNCMLSQDASMLQPLLAAATHDASAAMCRWTGGRVELTLDEVREVPLEEACMAIDVGSELLTMVVQSLPGEAGGDMILTFDERSGRELAAALLHRPVETSPDWTDLEKSALMETGNILSGAYMNSLTRLLGIELVPQAPTFIQDYGASVIQQALMGQAATCDRVLICRTSFRNDGRNLNWNVFFVPTVGMRKAMERAFLQ